MNYKIKNFITLFNIIVSINEHIYLNIFIDFRTCLNGSRFTYEGNIALNNENLFKIY